MFASFIYMSLTIFRFSYNGKGIRYFYCYPVGMARVEFFTM